MYYANFNMIGYLPTADGYECDTLEEAIEALVESINDELEALLADETNDEGLLTAKTNRVIAELRACTELPIAVIYEGYCYFISESE